MDWIGLATGMKRNEIDGKESVQLQLQLLPPASACKGEGEGGEGGGEQQVSC